MWMNKRYASNTFILRLDSIKNSMYIDQKKKKKIQCKNPFLH